MNHYNKFDFYYHAMHSNQKCHKGHLIVKDHELLKCIIEVIKILHDDGVLDNIIDLT